MRADRSMALWLLNATINHSDLASVIQQARNAGQPIHVLHHRRDRDAILQAVPPGDPPISLIEVAEESYDLPGGFIDDKSEVIFLPCSARIDWVDLRERRPLAHPHCLQPLVAQPPRVTPFFHFAGPTGWWGWRATGALARRILREPSAWEGTGIELVETIQKWPDPPRWQSIPFLARGTTDYPISSPPVMTMLSSVLAVISYYRCEKWLHACLTSMTQQTHPPENIVVIDDCSPELPVDLLETFPDVTLLSSTRRVGSEKILDGIVKATSYNAYMVQDADDWSSHDRLELSLREAERSGADMVGTHEFRINHPSQALELGIYPPDVNAAMRQGLAHYILHCTSVISRALIMRVGGFDQRFKLLADTDFLMRAWYAGQIVNLPAFCLFHRIRPGSITTHVETGYESPTRLLEDRFMKILAIRNLQSSRAGLRPELFAKQFEEPVGFIHHRGPELQWNGRLSRGTEPQ